MQFLIVHIHESRQLLHLGHQSRTPSVDIFQPAALHGELIDAGGELPAHTDRRGILQERKDAGNLQEFRSQFLDHLVDIQRPLIPRLEVGEHEGLVAGCPARAAESSHPGHVGVGLHGRRDHPQMLRHGIERHILRAHHHSESEPAVLAGNEAARHDAEQVYRAHQHRHRYQHRHWMEAQRDPQRRLVPARQPIEAAFQHVIKEPVPLSLIHI